MFLFQFSLDKLHYNLFTVLSNTSCIGKLQVMSGGGHTPCTLPLDPPLFNLLSMDTLGEYILA